MSGAEVVITGIGVVSPIGSSLEAATASLKHGRHGLSKVSLVPGREESARVVGKVSGYAFPSPDVRDWVVPDDSAVDPVKEPTLAPHGVFAVDALEQALDQAGWEARDWQDPRTGLAAASSGSPMLLKHHLDTLEATAWRRGHPYGVVRSVAGTLNFNLAARYGIQGASTGFVSACASSSHALGYAVDEIKLGRQERMIVVAAEEVFVESVLPFDAMRALTLCEDPNSASRPFDRGRDGFVMAEGAVAMVLEASSTAIGKPLAKICGWGQAADGYHVASPDPEGRGLCRAMRRALGDAEVSADDIDYVNAHATSTVAGDRAEALALRSVFAEGGKVPRIVSTKGLTGHGLSYAGLLEAAIVVISLSEGFVPGNVNLREPDPACEGLPLPISAEAVPCALALTNSSGFGGANVCHVLARV